jgi:archaellum component FlaF (FlaF/FlaG flagellin family)
MSKIYTFFLFSLAISLQAQLKEFHVTEREPDETSVVQANTDYPDNAMLLIYSDLPNLDFRSTVGGINQQRYNSRASRYEILVKPQRQIIMVSASGFIEMRVGLINPSPKQVFYYQVEERKGQDEISVYFNVQPNDAKLFVDNIPIEVNQTVSVPLGVVNIRLEKEGYSPIDQSLEITPAQVNYTFKMREVELEAVQIKTNVEGARVVIDGMEKGQTSSNNSMSIFLFPGDYTVEVQKNLYLSQTQTIVVEEDKQNVFTFELERNTGIIVLKVSPPNTKISINRSPIGGERELEYTPGRYRIDFECADHESYFESVDVVRGERHEVNVELKPHTGGLQFTVSPDNAKVVLRDAQGKEVQRWEGLKMLKNLRVGEYELEVSASGYRTERKTLFITKDERSIIQVTMEEGTGRSSQSKKRTTTSRSGSSIPSFKGQGAGGDQYMALMLTFLPHQTPVGFSFSNSNFGLNFTYVPEKVGFYAEFGSSFNFSSTIFEYEEGQVFTTVTTITPPENGDFLPEANIRSNEFGGGVVYRVANVSLMAGLSYYTYQFRQQFDTGALQNPFVLIADRSFSGIIPKVGAHADFNGFAVGLNFSTYRPNSFAAMLMLGIAL